MDKFLLIILKNLLTLLWKCQTRTDRIPNNFEIYKIINTKEIASIVRKHIKSRFPMCKFSVRGDYNSIDIDLLASPFEKDGDELNAIVHYVYVFTESYNYDNSDSMTDYFDVNFYFSGERNIISSCYKQTEMTKDIEDMITLFRAKKAEWEKSEQIRKEKELIEQQKQMEIDRQLAAEVAKREEADCKAIESGVRVCDCESPYYIIDTKSTNICKCDSVDKFNAEIENGEYEIHVCQITREVFMSEELYNKFKNMLLCDFSFLSGKGGTGTIDNRISEMLDYTEMTKEERETVEFYDGDCVAVYCDNKLMIVCNPEGFSYARYVLIPEEKYTTTRDYKIEQILSEDELKVNSEIADNLYDASAEIIINNQLYREWNGLKFDDWRRYMTEYIKRNNIPFSVNIVRAIPKNLMDFKVAMYRLLKEPESIRKQFDDANFVEGQKLTIIKLDKTIGYFYINHITFSSYEYTDWGGKNGVKLVLKIPRKHGERYKILNSECLIIDGWVEVPRELFWEELSSKTGLKCERCRFLSFDSRQYDVTLDYFNSIGIKPIINTYKPQFN